MAGFCSPHGTFLKLMVGRVGVFSSMAEGGARFWSLSPAVGALPWGGVSSCTGWWLRGTQARSFAARKLARVFLETSAPRAWHNPGAATKGELQKTCK